VPFHLRFLAGRFANIASTFHASHGARRLKNA
jgi:hypothetical protein